MHITRDHRCNHDHPLDERIPTASIRRLPVHEKFCCYNPAICMSAETPEPRLHRKLERAPRHLLIQRGTPFGSV